MEATGSLQVVENVKARGEIVRGEDGESLLFARFIRMKHTKNMSLSSIETFCLWGRASSPKHAQIGTKEGTAKQYPGGQ